MEVMDGVARRWPQELHEVRTRASSVKRDLIKELKRPITIGVPELCDSPVLRRGDSGQTPPSYLLQHMRRNPP
jgi:hypothetical protein